MSARTRPPRKGGWGWGVSAPRLPDDSPEGSRLTPHPFATLTQPLRLTNGRATAALPKTYVLGTETPYVQWRRAYLTERVSGPEWRLVELPTSHAPMDTLPERVLAILLETLAPRSAGAGG